ncbi:MAG: DUF5050 domain-containing protein [Ruminococcaceae bacterium]|nr:DUF5050 domain-containing protein [Oscillospiraceae bacterium]
MQMDLTCPVENRGVTVKTNSKTGEPYALFKLFNLSEQVIQSVSFTVHAYDAYGGELGQLSVQLADVHAEPKQFFAANKAVSLEQFPEAKHIVADFLEVQFEEGEPYVKGDNLTEVKITEPDYDEQMRLLTAAGEDACCYAKDEATYWVCVCGRPNLPAGESCVRCGRDKTAVLSAFSSRDALTQTLEEQEAARLAEEEARRQEEARRKEERRRKVKKGVLCGAGAILALVVLYMIGRLIYGGVSVALGNSAAKKNDYLSAYTHYAAAGNSKKVATVSEQVKGNSSSNLMQSGILAADEENIYYIDLSYAIYKEEKATGEKTRLGDASGVYLNVLDGWVYYTDAATGNSIWRIRTDGSSKELLYEEPEHGLGNLTLVGNELYFVVAGQNEDLTPEMQEYMAQTGDTSMMYQYRLCRLKIGAKKPKEISETDIIHFIYYKDRIYYIKQNEQAIYSMNREGGDVQKLVSGPVLGFDVHQDALYYIDGTVTEEGGGMPKYSLEIAELDGTYRESALADVPALIAGVDGEDIYFITYEMSEDGPSQEIFLCKKTAGGEVERIDTSQLFNQADGYLMYLHPEGRFIKSTFDKSGFESVPMPTIEVPEGDAPAGE